MTLDYDARFWLTFYRWSIQTPLMRSIEVMTRTTQAVANEIARELLPAVREATWAMQDFAFAVGASDHPSQRPRFWRLERALRRAWLTWDRFQRGG